MIKERILITIDAIIKMNFNSKELLKLECMINSVLLEELKPDSVEVRKMKNNSRGFKIFSNYLDNRTRPSILNINVKQALWNYYTGNYYRIRNRKNLEVYKEENKKLKCIFCSSTKNLEVDHIIPVAIGGKDVEENYNIICSDCNKIKSKRIAGIDMIHF